MIAILVAVLSVVVMCLVATRRINFPILFDIGLSLISLGGIAWIDSYVIKDEPFPRFALSMIGGGLLMLGASVLRQKKLRNERMRKGPPHELDGRHLTNVQGGKQ